jgi:hypothetical protein
MVSRRAEIRLRLVVMKVPKPFGEQGRKVTQAFNAVVND